MNLKELITDDKAVSPVIGVILMVAITVILAAVIGTFVLGIGQNQQTTPSSTWDWEWDSSANELTVTHAGGDTFTSENSNKVAIVGSTSNDMYCWGSCTSPGFSKNTTTKMATEWGGTGTGSFDISAGASVTGTATKGETVRIIWTAPGGGKTNTVGTFDVPS